MDDVFVYLAPLPNAIDEYVTPCSDGYTIYINEKLSRPQQIEAYNHAVNHIAGNDFEKYNVQEIERSIQ